MSGKTLSQGAEELALTIPKTDHPGMRELDDLAIKYLRRTGTPSPSKQMVMDLADAVDRILDDREAEEWS